MKPQRNHRGHRDNLTTENTEKYSVHSERLYGVFYLYRFLCVLCGFFVVNFF